MRKITVILVLCCFALCAHAETLLLRTGARVQGTIVFQNEEVVIIRNAEGARFQYPRTDVAEIMSDDVVVEEAPAEEAVIEEIKTPKKASILLELAGGAAIRSGKSLGGGFGVNLLVGSHHIRDRHVFIGGGVGYHGYFIGADNYNFLPIQFAVRMPLTESKHAPAFGVAVGYGIALSKNYLGGLYAGVDFGYRCQLNPKTAIGAMFFAQFQQAQVKQSETINGEAFLNTVGTNMVLTGVKLALYF